MMFKDLKIGYPVYILDRAKMNFCKAEVISVGTPYFPPINNPVQPVGALPNIQRIVDVTVSKNGENHIYSTSESSEICYCKDEAISTDKSLLLSELKAVKKDLENKISMHEKNKNLLDKCSSLLADLDDNERERLHNEQRIDALEKSLEKLNNGMGEILKRLQNKIEL